MGMCTKQILLYEKINKVVNTLYVLVQPYKVVFYSQTQSLCHLKVTINKFLVRILDSEICA